MLSRVADSLYWMSRYLERAENTVRLLDVTMSLMLDTGGSNVETRWQRMVAALGKPAGMEWNGSIEEMAQQAGLRPSQPGLCHLLRQCGPRKCAPGARRNLHRAVAAAEPSLPSDALAAHADRSSPPISATSSPSVIDGIYLFKGTTDTTMIHGQGWQFIRLGRYLERAYATATLLEVYQAELFPPQERESSGYLHLELVGLLRCCTAFEAYCQVYTADLSPERMLEFLVLNRDFPHAIHYCVEGTRQAVEGIQQTGGRRPPEELKAAIGKLCAMLGYTSINEILAGDTAGFLHNIRGQCLHIHELIYRFYVHYSIQSALTV